MTIQKHPAAVYNEKRRIVFSRLDTNPNEALKWLENYQNALGPAGYAGLSAEVQFYLKYKQEYQVIPGLDAGDATDFAAIIDGKMHRVDVTTNINFKELAAYSELQSQGHLYKIAVFDGESFDLVDINFPFCEQCKTGRVLPTAMLLSEAQSGAWNNNQLLIFICGSCGVYEIKDEISTPFLLSFDELSNNIREENNSRAENFHSSSQIDASDELKKHAYLSTKHLKSAFSQPIVATGGKMYKVTNLRDGGGEWTYQLIHRDAFIIDDCDQEFNFAFDDP